MRPLAILALPFVLLALPAFGAGDLSTRARKLETLQLGKAGDDYFVGPETYELESGKAYRLPVTSAGAKEMALVAPEFYNAIWLREIKVGDMEIHARTLEHLEFDGAGTIELYFVPVRTGTFAWEIEGLAEQGMKGTFVVK